jgi:hypothetical protein
MAAVLAALDGGGGMFFRMLAGGPPRCPGRPVRSEPA